MQILTPFLLLLAPCKNNSHVLDSQNKPGKAKMQFLLRNTILFYVAQRLFDQRVVHTFHNSNRIKNIFNSAYFSYFQPD